jgi:hypothetical protein
MLQFFCQAFSFFLTNKLFISLHKTLPLRLIFG